MKPDEKDKIPLFKTWRQWYIFVVLVLLVQIIIFYWITEYFA
jgi:hypothetical protein